MIKSLRLQIRGTVQGVGFRPWIYRLANQLQLNGFVRNSAQGAFIEIEGPESQVENFVHLIRTDAPAHCVITQCLISDIPSIGFQQFQILPSQDEDQHEALVLPDIASCPDCIHEVFDKNDRRYLYPFTNCTHCGPRYSIIEALPYDRANTSMKKFQMCKECQDEYDDPSNRRFHAQPNACPVCGPKLALCDDKGEAITTSDETLSATVDLVNRGMIVAVKALGGFYLIADALNADAVALLRKRKERPHKPFAVMMPSLEMTAQYCQLGPLESKLIQSSQAPIVLLQKLDSSLSFPRATASVGQHDRKRESISTPKIAPQVSPHNPYLGCMLPSMPLLHTLMKMINKPIVATSGNISEEPICIDNNEALSRLKGIADFFLVHDRPIVRHVDDSIVQLLCNDVSMLRRARGYVPLPIDIKKECNGILAAGSHQKSTVALGIGTSVILSQHIGDLDNKTSCLTYEKTISSLKSIYDAPIIKAVCDPHPDYASSRYAHALGVEVLEVQHHFAHVASCMAEHGISKEVLGIAWDGTGYGLDNTIWGSEFMITDGLNHRRFAHLNLFALPGAERAIKEPRRTALGMLYKISGGKWDEFKDLPCVKAFDAQELQIIEKMLKQNLNSPMTSSMGRLFDGIASLVGLCHHVSFEGQAAMSLEYQVSDKYILAPYYYEVLPEDYKNRVQTIDWSSMVKEIIDDIRMGRDAMLISTRFHLTLVKIIVDIAHQANKSDVVLSGGCFQNKWLLENTVNALREQGFNPYWQTMVPANDGGISLGQMYAAASRLKDKYVSGNSR